ncbi:MAG TPA: phytanoyl-CoA dioxygenase family protein [Myxococcota bacterium]|nr:phytanoyl-CoA dioxygenase family protein [Myxococcota bacterium]
MTIQHLPATASPEEVTAVLQRDGVAVVDRLVPRAFMERAKAELAPFLERTALGTDPFAGFRTRRTGGLIARSAACRELVMNPLVLGAVKGLLSDATSFQLHLTQVIAIGPDEPAQAVHRDQWGFDFYPFPKGYEVQCNTIWAMTDFTAENGATRVIPGSHLHADRIEYKESDTEPAEMEQGSVVFYSGALYHGGGANHSSAPRMGINLTYARSWLRQEENQYLSVPHDIARGLPDDLLRLIGYARGAYALGYVDDLRDPLDALRGVSEARSAFGELQQAAAKAREAIPDVLAR